MRFAAMHIMFGMLACCCEQLRRLLRLRQGHHPNYLRRQPNRFLWYILNHTQSTDVEKLNVYEQAFLQSSKYECYFRLYQSPHYNMGICQLLRSMSHQIQWQDLQRYMRNILILWGRRHPKVLSMYLPFQQPLSKIGVSISTRACSIRAEYAPPLRVAIHGNQRVIQYHIYFFLINFVN